MCLLCQPQRARLAEQTPRKVRPVIETDSVANEPRAPRLPNIRIWGLRIIFGGVKGEGWIVKRGKTNFKGRGIGSRRGKGKDEVSLLAWLGDKC